MRCIVNPTAGALVGARDESLQLGGRRHDAEQLPGRDTPLLPAGFAHRPRRGRPTRRHDGDAALKLLRRLLNNQGIHPETITTDELASYRAAARELGLTSRHRPGGMRENNRAENSHLAIRRRERKQQKFKSQGSAQRFLASHAAVYNTFNIQPHLISRPGLIPIAADADSGIPLKREQ